GQPEENPPNHLVRARLNKTQKYKPLLSYFNDKGYSSVEIVPIVVGALGARDPENEKFLRKICTASYLKLMRKLCVSDSIMWSRDIYIQHRTGKKQYGGPQDPSPGVVQDTDLEELD
ncbi:uncharacterized protein NPIL_314221, partial [Nephila pilipes]